jgi:hypothetical protein
MARALCAVPPVIKQSMTASISPSLHHADSGLQALSSPAIVKQAQAQTGGSSHGGWYPTWTMACSNVVSRLTLSPVGSPSDVQARRRARRLWNLSILGVTGDVKSVPLTACSAVGQGH